MRIFRLTALIVSCCLLICVSYLLLLRTGLAIWHTSLNPFYTPGIGLDPQSGSFLGLLLITFPYIIGGIYLGLFRAARYALPVGLLATLVERLLIFLAAAYVLGQFRQVTETGDVYYVAGGPDIVMATRSEALPYFSWPYILLGIPMSILVLYLTARRIEQFRV